MINTVLVYMLNHFQGKNVQEFIHTISLFSYLGTTTTKKLLLEGNLV